MTSHGLIGISGVIALCAGRASALPHARAPAWAWTPLPRDRGSRIRLRRRAGLLSPPRSSRPATSPSGVYGAGAGGPSSASDAVVRVAAEARADRCSSDGELWEAEAEDAEVETGAEVVVDKGRGPDFARLPHNTSHLIRRSHHVIVPRIACSVHRPGNHPGVRHGPAGKLGARAARVPARCRVPARAAARRPEGPGALPAHPHHRPDGAGRPAYDHARRTRRRRSSPKGQRSGAA